MPPPTLAFVFSGQSNMSAYSPMGTLRGSGLVTNPGSPGTPPDYIPGYQQTATNEWTGAPPASVDTGIMWPYPTDANSPCLYNENSSGTAAQLYDSWGTHVKQYQQYPSGTLGDGAHYGPELSFLQSHLAAYPGTPIAAVKVASGGTSLAGDWMSWDKTLGTMRAASPTAVTLDATDGASANQYAGLYLKVLTGTGAGSTALISANDATTKVATISGWSGATPANGSTYGIERGMCQQLRTAINQAAARLNTSPGAGNWRWAGSIWMQGESGAHANLSGGDAAYLADSRTFHASVRGFCGDATMPVIIGRVGDNWTRDNAYLASIGFPYGAIDYSINGSDGEVAGLQATRDAFNAGAYTRRATQLTLAADPHCAGYSNDGYTTVPYINQKNFYHFSGSGNLTQGERAFAAWQTLAGRRRVRIRAGGGRPRLRIAGA